jgi:hypothetical protein
VNEGLKGTLSLMLGVGMASASLFCDEPNVIGWFREESRDRGCHDLRMTLRDL